MAVQTPQETGLDQWKNGIEKAVKNDKWNFWDCEIQRAVNEYNRHLSDTAKDTGYKQLDWKIIKAMIWVETGANNSEWDTRPMQIGVNGDPGMKSLLSGEEGGDLILPPNLKEELTEERIQSFAAYNIRAGIGYLLMRMAKFESQSVPDADTKEYEITVKPGDNLTKIAKAHGSTVDMLKKLNPTASGLLYPKQKLKCQKASVQRVITGWREIDKTSIAQRYNGRGDTNYADKLDYALSLVRKGKAVKCEEQ
jgi:hypothetical protein